jgi:prefoldin subunit 5
MSKKQSLEQTIDRLRDELEEADKLNESLQQQLDESKANAAAWKKKYDDSERAREALRNSTR